MNKKTVLSGLGAVVALAVALGCGTGQTGAKKVETPVAGTTAGSPPADPAAPAEPSEAKDGEPAPFGRAHGWKYEDGLVVSIDSVKLWKPSSYAAGHKPGNKAVKVIVTIVNKTGSPFDASLVDVKASFGPNGNQAERVFDGDVTGMDGTVANGRTKTATFGFSAPGPINPLELSVEPSWDYSAALFSGSVK